MNDIRTVTLRFVSPTAKKFDEYARKRRYVPSWSMDGRWQKACIVFQNRTDKTKFMKDWCNESCEGYEPALRFK